MRIATFNLENFDDRPGEEPPLAARIGILRPQLERVAADILCLQEVNARRVGPKGTTRTLSALDQLLDGTEYGSFHRVHTELRDRRGPLDVHNLVILSRYPVASHHQYWHDLAPPPAYRPVTADPEFTASAPIEWDRPALHAAIEIPDGRLLHVINLHLRAPLAALIRGQKEGQFCWKSVPGWAEGFFVAAIKRCGQALEVRFAIDRVFDDTPDALIAVCGDMNAELREMPLRILRGEEADTANGALAGRVMIPLDRTAPESQRFSVLHDGMPVMLDHVLVSRALLRHFDHVEIHNEALEDELVGYARVHKSPESYHAPVTAEFSLG